MSENGDTSGVALTITPEEHIAGYVWSRAGCEPSFADEYDVRLFELDEDLQFAAFGIVE